jgi:hypothetical protein
MIIHRFKNAEGVEFEVELTRTLRSYPKKRKGKSVRPVEWEGDCGRPEKDEAIVRLSRDLFKPNRNRRQLSIILEELLHAHDWGLTEKVVRKYSANTAKFLYMIGWRPSEHTNYKTQIKNHGRRKRSSSSRGTKGRRSKTKNC